jgi:hypothetical protein
VPVIALAGLVDGPALQAGIVAAVLLCLGVAGNATGWLLGSRVRERTAASRLRSMDAAGGSVVAVVASLIAIWFLALNLVTGPFRWSPSRSVARQWFDAGGDAPAAAVAPGTGAAVLQP